MKIIWLLFFLPSVAWTQINTTAIDAYMKAQAKLYAFNGNVLVAKKGKVIYKQSFGYSDYETKKSLSDNSIFDCGSIAKEFTAMGILLLKDKGLISYSDTLRKFFPELPYTNITVQQLLTHTSGMADGFDLVEKYFDHSKIATNDDLIHLLATEKPALLFKPGENLMYSGTGFNLLASIIEKISGQSYKTYMMEKVFKPLGMTHTQVANGPRSIEQIPGFAYGFIYSDSLKKFIRADSQLSGWTTFLAGITGEGMIITTTGDLLLWDRAIKNNNLLTATTQQQMLTKQAEKVFPKVAFGYGMRVGKNELGNFIFHNGYYPGYKCMHLRYTDDDITVIVLSNNESQSEFIADGLSAITLNKEIVSPYLHQETKQSVDIEKYTGKYMMPLTRPPYMAVFPVTFVNKNDTLYIQSPFGPDIRLKTETASKFFFANGTDQQIEFETDKSGSIVNVWHTAWGVRRVLKKAEP
ncbi:serine hydrolase domain-containing protein [Ferruginibacter sp. SUN106]|uniref:serine hydrolase domain-containing protein n=1 Tax=Ferruginibacter sp. SUN106 TaxID=2978348 RepID=UPI003D3699C8